MFLPLFAACLGLILVGTIVIVGQFAYAYRRFRADEEPPMIPVLIWLFLPLPGLGMIGGIAVVILRAFGYLQ